MAIIAAIVPGNVLTHVSRCRGYCTLYYPSKLVACATIKTNVTCKGQNYQSIPFSNTIC